MSEISADLFKILLLGGSKWVIENREELNRINRFPVADSDTGTNLSTTLFAVYQSILNRNFSTTKELIKEAAKQAFINARGNSGVIISQYFSALSKYLKKEYLEIKDLAVSFKKAYHEVLDSMENPIEGTILTVMKDIGNEAEKLHNIGIREFLSKLVEKAKISMERTREMLPVLKREGVVDSGAKGLVLFLEGMKLALENKIDLHRIDFNPMSTSDSNESGLYCTVITIKTRAKQEEISRRIAIYGNSIIISGFENLLKVHIHTSSPEKVRETLSSMGEIISSSQELIIETEDSEREIGIIVDSALDIPRDLAKKLKIEVIPLGVIIDGKILKDQEEISREIIASKLIEKKEVSSSLPAPSDFIRTYSKLKRRHEILLSFHLSHKVSGTYNLSRSIARKLGINAHVIDTKSFSLGGGLKALYAVELIDKGVSLNNVLKIINEIESHTFVLVDDLTYGIKGGRVKPWKGKLQKYLGLGIIMGFSDKKEGLYLKAAAPGKTLSLKLLKRKIIKELSRGTYDIGIAFTREDPIIENIENFLRENVKVRKLIKSITSPAIMVHAGPSAFGVFAIKID